MYYNVALGAEQKSKPKNPEFENNLLKIKIIPRTPEQMAAFYEGRGFPGKALLKIKKACFMTVVVENKSDTVIWLELNNWRLVAPESATNRLDRDYWKQHWETIQLPMSNQSTFGWTLMPEQRDLQPDESVGGNITFTQAKNKFSIKMTFNTAADKKGETIDVRFNDLECRLK